MPQSPGVSSGGLIMATMLDLGRVAVVDATADTALRAEAHPKADATGTTTAGLVMATSLDLSRAGEAVAVDEGVAKNAFVADAHQPSALKVEGNTPFNRLGASAGGAVLWSANEPETRTDTPPAGQADPKFEIRRFVVEGATLITEDEISNAISRFSGKEKDFADVQRALEALEKIYSEKGYSAVQVILPEQELDRGEVHFKVVEAKIGRVIVEGNKFFDEENIRRSVPAIAPGKSPNVNDIARSLRAANDNAAKQTTALLRGGADEGTVDALLRVTDEHPRKYSITFDNTGTAETGIHRLGFGFQHSNLWGRDHSISGQYVISPSQQKNSNSMTLWPNPKVMIVGAAYRVPLYESGDSLEFSFGYSNVRSGTIASLFGQFSVAGAGTIFSARYSYNFRKIGELEHRLAIEQGWRGYDNRTIAVSSGAAVLPDVTVHPFSLTYSGLYRTASSETAFYLTGLKNLPGGNDGDTAVFNTFRPGAVPGYTVWRYGVSHNRAFDSDWQSRASFSGQQTRNRLISGEQFGAGGADSVRGFLEREVANDNGYRGTVEAYTPDFGGKLPFLPSARARGVFFYDWAQVMRYNPQPTDRFVEGISSFGLGARISSGSNISLRIDYGVVLNPGGNQGKWEGRIHSTFSYIF